MKHPLDPLSADEIATTAAILRRDRDVEPPRWRFGCIELREPSKAALASGDTPRVALATCWNRERRPDLQGARLAGRRQRPVVGAPARRAGELHRGRVLRGQRDAGEGSARPGDAGALRRPRRRPGPLRHLGLRRAPRGRALPGPASGLDRCMDPQLGDREPVRESDQRPDLRDRRQLDGAAGHRGDRGGRAAEDDGRVRAGARARPAAARRPEAARDHPARRRVVRGRGQPPRVAALVDAPRLQPARGARRPHRRLRGRRARAAGRAPHVVRRDGRPLPRPDRRPHAPHRLRHRRVGPRLHDHLAGAGL